MNFKRNLLSILSFWAIVALTIASIPPQTINNIENTLSKIQKLADAVKDQVACTCAVFLNGQFVKGSMDPPSGNPALLYEQTALFPCTPQGNKQCTNRCLETVSHNFLYLSNQF